MRPPTDAKKGLWTSYADVGDGGAAAAAKRVMKKGPWTAEEGRILKEYVGKHGEGNWNAVQMNSGLQRSGKSCRLRWLNHLRPNLKKGPFSEKEVADIHRLHAVLGNKWAQIANQLNGRTDNDIKNYWNTFKNRMKKKGLLLNPQENQQRTSSKSPGREQSSSSSRMLLESPQTTVSSVTSVTPLISENQYGYILEDPNREKNILLQLPCLTCPVQNCLGKLDLGPLSYSVKLPSSQFSSNYGGEQLPQGNNRILDDLRQAINSHGIHVIADLLETDVPTLIDMIQAETTAPTLMFDLPDSISGGDFSNGPSYETTDENIELDMQQLVWMPSMGAGEI